MTKLTEIDGFEKYIDLIDKKELRSILKDHPNHHIAIVASKTTSAPHLVCHTCRKSLKKYQKCEVYSRCCGYLRPVGQWHEGKKAEFKARKTYELKEG